eukprot:3054179-Prymnesium_polylepis.1
MCRPAARAARAACRALTLTHTHTLSLSTCLSRHLPPRRHAPLSGATAAPEGIPNASVHRFAVPPAAAARRLTHIRLNQHPDGGIARMRAWGIVAREYGRDLAADAVGPIDLLSALNGARALGCSNRHCEGP